MRDLTARLEFSPSGLSTLAQCVRKWRYTYQEGFRTWEQRAQFAEGILAHAILEAVLGGTSTLDRARDVAEAHVAREGWDREPSSVQAGNAVLRAHRFLADLAERWPGYRVEAVEEELSVPHPADPTIHLTGRTDARLFVPGVGRIVPDFKNRARASTSHASHYTHDAQSRHYVCAYRLLGLDVTESGLLFCEGPGHVMRWVTTTPTQEALDAHLATLLDLAARVRGPSLPSDRTLGECFSFGRICEHSTLCAAERDGDLVAISLERGRRGAPSYTRA